MRTLGVGQEGNNIASSAGTSTPRLVAASHEFEAQMMKELLKPLEKGQDLGEADGDVGSDGVLGEFATEALGRALSQHGGMGIASRILNELGSGATERNPGSNQIRKDTGGNSDSIND